MRIQAIFDLKAERYERFELTPYTHNDQAGAKLILSLLRPGDLVVRDLGYFVLGNLRAILDRGAFFLSRLRHKTILFSADGTCRLDLLRELRRHGRLDRDVLLGADAKLPVRLVALRVPKRVGDERRRKLRQNRDKRCHPDKRQLALQDWTILITNVSADVWSPETVAQVYGLRWRIEIVFKAWKSHFHMAHISERASRSQIEVLVYARLLSITLFQTVFWRPLQERVRAATGRDLSLLKFAQFFSQNSPHILHLLSQPDGSDILVQLLAQHCAYDKRKRRNHAQNMRDLGGLLLMEAQ